MCNIQNISNSNKIFCSSPYGNYEDKSFISELTKETTSRVEILDDVFEIFNFDEFIYFSNWTSLEGTELWKSDSNYENYYLLDNINKKKHGIFHENLEALNSGLIFTANDGNLGNELWGYKDGNINFLKDITIGEKGSYFCEQSFTNFGDYIYFSVIDVLNGYELWKTDGTKFGTEILLDVGDSINYSDPKLLTIHKESLFFITYKDKKNHLCKYDGSNVEFILDFGENQQNSSIQVREMISSGNHLYIITDHEGMDLWKSDGTKSGTYKLKDFSTCSNITSVSNKVFFTASEEYEGEVELWKTEGTELSTTLVKDIGLGYSSNPLHLTNCNNTLLFTANTNENGRELWKSDGTALGTNQLADIYPGAKSAFANPEFCLQNDKLFFSAMNASSGFEIWSTDGTENGTQMIKDINNGSQSSFPSKFKAINNNVYFQAYDLDHGFELWKTDGTEQGTSIVADVIPGNLSSTPLSIAPLGDDIFFIADTEGKGRQIWRLKNALSSDKDVFNGGNIKFYPNPSDDSIYLKSNFHIESIKIYTSTGQLIKIEKPINNKIDISQFASGVYILKCTVNSRVNTFKFIKK